MHQPAAPAPPGRRGRFRPLAALLLAATLGSGATPLAAAAPPPESAHQRGEPDRATTPDAPRDGAGAERVTTPAATPAPVAATPVPAAGEPADVGAPPTAADNQGLTAGQLDAWIAQTRPDSPLRGFGAFILAEANRRDISVPLFLGIALKESGLGTTAGPGKALTGIIDPVNDGGLGNQRAYRSFASWQEAILATLDLLGTETYRGRSVAEQIGAWYVGPQEFARAGLAATDRAGNGSVADYLGVVAEVYRAFGKPLAAASDVATQTSAGQLVGAGLATIWGGGDMPIAQEFGDTDYARGNPLYDYSRQFGVSGHTGLDIGLAHGTPLYAPAGGTVVVAGGSGYYADETGRHDPATSGELRLRLDSGHELILGHLSRIAVRVGQRVGPGEPVGWSGTVGQGNVAHLHLEYRVPDRATTSGWRIVDPRPYLR